MMTMTSADAQGWYFYGITRHGPLPAISGDAASLQLVDCSGLAAVVRPVRLADFSPEVWAERLRSAPELEVLARSHNDVIEAIHAQQPILPARLGVVYAHVDEVVSALRPAHDALRRQLDHMEARDEWAVHLYAECATVQDHISAEDPAIRLLREECAASRPGLAYFLQQKLRAVLEAATSHTLSSLARNAFERLADCAVAGQVNDVGPAADPEGEVEILRASFLVDRNATERFKNKLCAEILAGVRYEFSGPWPPYSFAVLDDMVAT
jgi:hypothetical protein